MVLGKNFFDFMYFNSYVQVVICSVEFSMKKFYFTPGMYTII